MILLYYAQKVKTNTVGYALIAIAEIIAFVDCLLSFNLAQPMSDATIQMALNIMAILNLCVVIGLIVSVYIIVKDYENR
jgi:hypothetical protein